MLAENVCKVRKKNDKLPNGVFRSTKIFAGVGVLKSSFRKSIFEFGVLFCDGEPNFFESKSLCVNRGISMFKLGSSSGFFFTLFGSGSKSVLSSAMSS